MSEMRIAAGNEVTQIIPDELYARYKSDGFSDEEIAQIWKDRSVMLELYYNKTEKEPREITSAAYLRSEKSLKRQVDNWFGIKTR